MDCLEFGLDGVDVVDGDVLAGRALDDGFNLRLVVETLQIIILQESHQLAKSYQVVQHYHFLLPLAHVALVYLLVNRHNAMGQLILERHKGPMDPFQIG